ncbi:hypothetical protein [Nonlabens ponticola]|uniref:Uncharacterized protein n=1 Tax=Nonlabens ponticola TaxID=2496866 RepID=A0A3S9MV23_9FLAO|nr:hypothetical protein [Nonlabens ponticola]AZQ42980.1 hypothetical protein EJ995_01550 [Nonlabens ponticola]
MMNYRLSMVVVVVLAFAKAYSQKSSTTNQKVEQESRIALEQMDDAARILIVELGATPSRTKLYEEQDGSKKSYEAKFKVNRKKYSAEFDRNWQLEDVEIKSTRRSIDKKLWRSINSQLDTMARKWRLEKMQLQYLPSSDVRQLKQKISSKQFDNLELIVAFKNNKAVYRKELLFSSRGKLLSQRDIKRRRYDFLLF